MRIVVLAADCNCFLCYASVHCSWQTTVFYVIFLLKLVCGWLVCSVCLSSDELDPESNELNILF